MNNDLNQRVYNHLEVIYENVYDTAHDATHDTIYEARKVDIDITAVTAMALEAMRLSPQAAAPKSHQNQWTERDIILISYGDSIVDPEQKPLVTLKHFIDNYTDGTINSLHILPFFPFSSDDGFSVIDFMQVNPSLGDWQDITPSPLNTD